VDHSAPLSGAHSRIRRLRLAALVCAAIVMPACAVIRRTPANDYGVKRCSASAADALLSVDALQCWFDARHGRWRTLKHESHFDVLVVYVESMNPADADEIARRFVDQLEREFSEVLVYVQPERASGRTRVRRIQWTRANGFSVLDFFEDRTTP